MYQKYGKRAIDCSLSLIGIVVLSALFFILCLLIKMDSKGPVIFKQKRVGRAKKYFYIYKFRTMRVDAPNEVPTHLLENPDYFITKVGKFLRKTSLDELPQLFNILKGDMAVIGPRPALWNQIDLIAERDKYGVNNLRPGLTGLAQISGRDQLKIQSKAQMDGQYVQTISFWTDFTCFFATICAVFRREGVVEGTNSTDKNERSEHPK